MNTSVPFKTQVVKILWIILAWTLVSLFQFLIGYGIILEAKIEFSTKVFQAYFLSSIITGIIAGTLGGITLVYLWEYWLRSKPYGIALLRILISYTVVFFIVALLTDVYFESSVGGKSFFAVELWVQSLRDFKSLNRLIPYSIWLIVTAFTVIVFLVNDKYGPGVFVKFLMGRYFRPRREERIFMFLDLRSSTEAAESLGESRYFAYLKDVFKYATPPILAHKGEIYQYVGDEIVISWEKAEGVENNNCIECYFSIRKALSKVKPYFEQHYGIFPEFKAGIHYGYVMAGEIGVVKREIAFSGDVLNTTARIQAKCNELRVDLLASKNLIDILSISNAFIPKEIGRIELRGKKDLVTLYAI